MHFVLEKGVKELDTEIRDLKSILVQAPYKYVHSYEEKSLKELKEVKLDKDSVIPVGTIDFIYAFYGKDRYSDNTMFMRPIEIPKCLRKEPFLLRDYKFVKYEDLPKTGRYFFKTASLLKGICGTVLSADEIEDYIESCATTINSDGGKIYKWNPRNEIYQISEPVTIKSEYRILVCDCDVISVTCYDGDPLVFPDSGIIKKAIFTLAKERINNIDEIPLAYTLDVAVTNRGTEILEIHNFVSCGVYQYLYSQDDLLYMYREGIDFEVKRANLRYTDIYTQ